RTLPSVDRLILSEEAKTLIETFNRKQVVNAARIVLENLRSEILDRQEDTFIDIDVSQEQVFERMKDILEAKFSYSLKEAVNATGVILHTGLGRAVLPEEALKNIQDVSTGYCTLAIDMDTGQRGHRDTHLNSLLSELTGAQSAVVVNNNAAATVLILNTLAKGKEVILSRGQLVEIGGSFRMPDIMAASGAILKEVGTTNKTHLSDYKNAIGENTGAIMRVHHSNYRIMGFAEEPSIEELAELANAHNLIIIDDIGSGALVNLKEFGLENEPLIRNSVKAGADVVCFSGDKLIGGPQSGIIVGKAAVIKKLKKNPLTRAFRVGKMTIAGLEATLKLFLIPEKLTKTHPFYQMLSLNLEDLSKRALRMQRKLRTELKTVAKISVGDGDSQVGSGSVPTEMIPTIVLKIRPIEETVDNLAKKLRLHTPPICVRVQKDFVLLDLRTIQKHQDKVVVNALLTILKT
ncbi:MAG: L-seryl-tRNA(Sec) selenium transferase, partial [Candidatus Aminicenantes bacterium]|nr:L-seryl-tRNA(Sec) selenium transferase [Candidatus Aminicenantes bacterium]